MIDFYNLRSPFSQAFSKWRTLNLNSLDRPLSLSKKDFQLIREEMVQLIKKISDTVAETKPEEIYCFNLDFFKV